MFSYNIFERFSKESKHDGRDHIRNWQIRIQPDLNKICPLLKKKKKRKNKEENDDDDDEVDEYKEEEEELVFVIQVAQDREMLC